jgi:hypothetical protein
MLKRHANVNNISIKNMNSSKNFVLVGSLLACALLSLNARAFTLTETVSSGANPQGIFTYTPLSTWNSGDISLPDGGVRLRSHSTLQLDIDLTGTVTLDNPDGTVDYGWMENFYPDANPSGEPNSDLGSVFIELLYNGTPVTSEFGYNQINGFDYPVGNYGTGSSTVLPVALEFNQVDVFISTSNCRETLTDFEVGFGEPAVPDTSNTLLLLFLGVVGMLGVGHRQVISVRSQP